MSSEAFTSPPSHTAIEAQGLGKRFALGHRASAYRTIREDLTSWRHPDRRKPDGDRTHWAIRDVSFTVTSGERLGVIGRNGAGKSTLLKVLSRITPPTEGRAITYGHVGSLLEVGTGFHPELSGRDNVFLSGAILGMRRAQIRERLDEIVEFAGVAKFLDTPVKRYSSGMYLRLAFAVAAHLEPDILIVDEVLAVGDADFQQKCLARMSEYGESGRTVLFVSHSMPAIARLCDRVILLEGGTIVADGDYDDVVAAYVRSGAGASSAREWGDVQHAPGDEVIRIHSIEASVRGAIADEVDIREPIQIAVEYSRISEDPTQRPSVNLHLWNEQGVCLFVTNDFSANDWIETVAAPGRVRSVCRIPGNFMAEGRVFVHAAITSYNPTIVHVHERDAISFLVVDRSTGDGVRGEYGGDWQGVVRPMLDWNVTRLLGSEGGIPK